MHTECWFRRVIHSLTLHPSPTAVSLSKLSKSYEMLIVDVKTKLKELSEGKVSETRPMSEKIVTKWKKKNFMHLKHETKQMGRETKDRRVFEKKSKEVIVVLARLLLLLGTACRVVYFAASYRTLLMKEHWVCKSISIG